jgi:hypothetical protein
VKLLRSLRALGTAPASAARRSPPNSFPRERQVPGGAVPVDQEHASGLDR